MFDKSQRSTFKYWFAHLCAFNMVALLCRHWKFKYLFHDWYKPWMKLFGFSYDRIQKFHRRHARHHLEYKGRKSYDYEAMIIDWECSRFTKDGKDLTAREKYESLKKKVYFTSETTKGLLKALDKLGL